MKILTVQQPWASLIGSGKKTIELRRWQTAYRGKIVIHSAATPSPLKHSFEIGPLGVLICVADLISVTKFKIEDGKQSIFCPSDDSWFSWTLDNIQPLPPVRVKGRLGLTNFSESLLAFPKS